MRTHLVGFLSALFIAAGAAAEDTPQPKFQPKFPPGFDCSAVAAGSQRQACNRSHLDPPMGAIQQPKRVKPSETLQQPVPQRLPTSPPATIPRLPGTIQN